MLQYTLILLIAVKASSGAITCTAPDAPEDGRIIGTPTIQTARGRVYAMGDVIRFACNSGFGLAGADEAVCMGDGQFSEDPPFCAAITCRKPTVENGVITTNSTTSTPLPPNTYRAGTVVTLSCNSGFTMVPAEAKTSRCQDSGQWSPNLAQCKQQGARCATPPVPDHATVSNQTPGGGADGFFSPGGFIEYHCDAGYETTDSEQVVCLIDGDWSESPPVCLETSQMFATPCPFLTLANGQITPEQIQYRVGDTATLTCNDGFTIQPIESAFLMCIEGGSWSPSVGACVPRDNKPAVTRPAGTNVAPPQVSQVASQCSSLLVEHGEVWPADAQYEVGTMVTLYCHAGYKVFPTDGDWSMCQSSGQWYPQIGTCVLATQTNAPPGGRNLTCMMPDTPPNTRIVLSRSTNFQPGSSIFSRGAKLVYACDENYYLTNAYYTSPENAPLQITIECNANGQWSSAPPVCRFNVNSTVPILDSTQIADLFKKAYWNSWGQEPKAKFRACAWGSVAEIIPDPDDKYRAIVICSSGSVMALHSNCSGTAWKSVIGPPRGIVGWSQDPFYAADLDTVRRQLYLTSSVKRLGILEANLDVVISAGIRGATVQPSYLVPGSRTGPQYEGIVVDADSRAIYSADSSSGRISVWGLLDGWQIDKIGRPSSMPTFQPRQLALSTPGGRQSRKLLAVTDYASSQLMLFLVGKDNISQSDYLETLASYAGRCDLGSIGRPGKVMFDQGGNLVVADGGCGRVQIFAADAATRRQPYQAAWVSRNLGQYVGAVTAVLSRYNADGTPTAPRAAVLAGLASGEVACF